MVDQINHHLYRKRGFYYFSRRVPKALLGDYPKSRIVLALKTRHYRDALRQSRCLNTSDSICDLFKWVCDRNDRNDKGNGKSYVRANDRGLKISCHSCHLCHI